MAGSALFGGIPALGRFFLSVGSPRVESWLVSCASSYGVVTITLPIAYIIPIINDFFSPRHYRWVSKLNYLLCDPPFTALLLFFDRRYTCCLRPLFSLVSQGFPPSDQQAFVHFILRHLPSAHLRHSYAACNNNWLGRPKAIQAQATIRHPHNILLSIWQDHMIPFHSVQLTPHRRGSILS